MNVPDSYYESPKQPLNIFTEYETMELLKLIEDPEIQKLFATYRKKHKYVWQLISNILAEKGINKSEDKCSNRFENMKAKFFKIEKRRMQGYTDDLDWPYYDFFVRFMNSSYMNNEQNHLPQPTVSLHQLAAHQPPYNMPKVKLEPTNSIPMMDAYHDNNEMLRMNAMQVPFGFNTTGVAEIQNTNPDIKPVLDYQSQNQQQQQQQQQHQQQSSQQPQQAEVQRTAQEAQPNQTEPVVMNENPEPNAEEEKQQVLISPHYVNNVERTDSEQHMENSNESTSNAASAVPLLSISNTISMNNHHAAKNNSMSYASSAVQPAMLHHATRKTPTRIPPNFGGPTNPIGLNAATFSPKIARKFKKIKIDEELMTIRKEKYALELEILRFQLDNEKKTNEKHLLDIKILEEKLKNEKYQNQILERKLKLSAIESSAELLNNVEQ